MHGYLNQEPEALALCVGPEGGFSPDEVGFLVAAGFKPLHFAGAILRAETAALYAVAAAQIILSERSSWIPKPL
jgi:16S rRNA (uracil1498-N3)-methyltransferase